MKKVGMYRRDFPRLSETFIREQAEKLEVYEPIFILCTLLKEIEFHNISISDNDCFKVKQLHHLITASPISLLNKDRLDELSLIHAHFGPDSIYAMRLSDKLNIPFIVTFYGYDATVSRKDMWLSGNPSFYQFLLNEEELKKKASVFIAFSSFLQKKLLERGYPKEKIVLLNSGIDTQKFSPKTQASDERYILSVGRHTEKKGIDTLLKAFARIQHKHPDISVIQVGTGKLSSELQALAKELGIENKVRFLGAKPNELVQDLMRGAEIFCLPSQTAKNGDSEGLPLVILEAAASAIPIVATLHSAIPDAVIDGKNGFLVPEKDHSALAEKLDILLSDCTLTKNMGEAGREFICENFDIRKQTRKLEEIYDEVIAKQLIY